MSAEAAGPALPARRRRLLGEEATTRSEPPTGVSFFRVQQAQANCAAAA